MWSFIHKHQQGFLSLLFAVAVALFWSIPYRCALSYQEQYQLFLFTPSYFTERISVPGGLADYVAEFITQFYYVYALGAILLALVFFSLQRLTWVLMRRNGVSPSWYPLSFIPAVALWALMGNENVLLSFAIALLGMEEMMLHYIIVRDHSRGWVAPTVYLLIAIPVGYWLVAGFIPAPDADGADIFSAQGSMVGYVDRMWLPGRVLYGNIDPEGLLGIVPAIGTALLGMFCGEWVKCDKEELTGGKKVLCMVVAGVVLLAVGLLWSQAFPINKKMWTSTFVLVVGAYSVLMFALFYYIIDVRACKWWTPFFTVIGMNSITIYLGQRFINFSYTADRLFGGLVHKLPEASQEFFSSAAYIAVCWLFLYFLYRKRVFLKV